MCTNFKLQPATDGTVVVGRTMEFPNLMPWEIQVLPVGHQGSATGVKTGITWKAKYGVVGMGGFKLGFLADGMNTRGLSAHALYMSGFCEYAKPTRSGNDLCEMDVIAYLLGTCKNVTEVKKVAAKMNVIGVDPGMGLTPPLHFLLHDATASVTIEFRADGMRVLDNPVGVGTNSPYLDWHLTNLRNYVGISAENPTQKVKDTTLTPLGQGGGLLGLPGDYTPPSRFVRAAALVLLVGKPKNAADAESMCMHMLNTFDIPSGLIAEDIGNGKMVPEVQVWVTVSNLTDGRYAYRTIDDGTPYVIDLATTDFTTGRRVPLPMAARFTPVIV